MTDNPSYDPRQAQGWLSPDEPVGRPQSTREIMRAIAAAHAAVARPEGK